MIPEAFDAGTGRSFGWSTLHHYRSKVSLMYWPLWSKRRRQPQLGLLEAHSCRNLTEASERAVLILRRRQATKLLEEWKMRLAELDRAGVAARRARLWAEDHPDARSSDAGTL